MPAVAVCSACRPCSAALTELPSILITLTLVAVSHGPGDAAAVAEYQRPKPRDAPYTPTTLVGARLPHVPLRVLQPGRLLAEGAAAHGVASTLDLPAAAGTSLVLLLSESQAVGAWEAAAAAAEAATGVPILPAVVAQSALGGAGSSVGGTAPGTAVVQDSGGAWIRLRGLPPEGALLVRPDGHIGWRHAGAAAGQQGASSWAAELERGVRGVMSL